MHYKLKLQLHANYRAAGQIIHVFLELQIVKKRQKDISDINQKIISIHAKGMIAHQISGTLRNIYGLETSEGFISDVTDKILPQLEGWQNLPLDEIYPVIFIDAIHYYVSSNGNS